MANEEGMSIWQKIDNLVRVAEEQKESNQSQIENRQANHKDVMAGLTTQIKPLLAPKPGQLTVTRV
jgi:hypothetical protein